MKTISEAELKKRLKSIGIDLCIEHTWIGKAYDDLDRKNRIRVIIRNTRYVMYCQKSSVKTSEQRIKKYRELITTFYIAAAKNLLEGEKQYNKAQAAMKYLQTN